MSLSFVVGNMVGRVVISYLVVLAVCCLLSEFRFRPAFAFSIRWYSLAIVALLAVLGAGVAVSRGGGAMTAGEDADRPDKGRRTLLIAGTMMAAGMAETRIAHARVATQQAQTLREMQIHRLPTLGLEVWVENQPPWQTEMREGAHPVFMAKTPERYHPPAVMTYASWPRERVADDMFSTMARSAITRAGRNFGVSMMESRALGLRPSRYGMLVGQEANFVGSVEGIGMDVRIFVGREAGRFPVVLTMQTSKRKIFHLEQHLMRAWGHVSYLQPDWTVAF